MKLKGIERENFVFLEGDIDNNLEKLLKDAGIINEFEVFKS